jgi:hypothetical protein
VKFNSLFPESSKSSSTVAKTDGKEQTQTDTNSSEGGNEMQTDDVTVRFNKTEIMPAQCLVKLPSKASNNATQNPIFMVHFNNGLKFSILLMPIFFFTSFLRFTLSKVSSRLSIRWQPN